MLFRNKLMLSRIRILFITLFLGAVSAVAQNVSVEASIDSTSILIGEQLHLNAKVKCPKGAKVLFPEYRDGTVVEGVEMLEAGKIDTTERDGRWELQRSYTLTSFDSAVYKIPRVQIEVNGKPFSSANEIPLTVNTVDVDTQHPDDIRPVKVPVEGVFVWSPVILLWSLVAWACLLVFVFCAYRLAVAKPVTRRIKITPPTPPQKTAISAIEQLRSNEKEGEHQKEYYMALTDVLRTYIVERFGFNAREMTTYEIVESLKRNGDEAALDELHEILSTADLVKFAKYEASLAESDRALLQAVDYVRTTQINDPEAEKAVEKIVEVSDSGQRAYKLTLKTIMALCVVAGMASTVYVVYLLWINFG